MKMHELGGEDNAIPIFNFVPKIDKKVIIFSIFSSKQFSSCSISQVLNFPFAQIPGVLNYL